MRLLCFRRQLLWRCLHRNRLALRTLCRALYQRQVELGVRMVRIEPQYPERCTSRAGSVEIVQVEFDVSPEGQTANAKVIESTNSCLNRAALRAVGRWKYQPKVVDNEAQWRRGVVTQIKFQLAEE